MMNETFSDEEAAQIIFAILKAIQEIHRQDVIHWDLKPGNVLFGSSSDLSSVKVCDFGLARKTSFSNSSQEYGSGGTLFYQAPEQAMGLPFSKVSNMNNL